MMQRSRANSVCPKARRHRNDTIDVWIDSGVRHAAVLATHPALRDPADMYLEATDQHRGWFQSSLMTSVALHDRAPYKTCVTHGFVVDVDGKKISKSSSYSKPMDAGHFVGKHGADIVRLWVSSVNYTDDVPFSEEMFTRLGDTYRRIRNTLRILLGNLAIDFDSCGRRPRKPASTTPASTLVDRWILARLENVIAECRAAYAGVRIPQGLSHAQSILRGRSEQPLRRYHQGPDVLRRADSPRRRATQMAMHRIFDALCRLLAPIPVFTAEEAWGYLGASQARSISRLFPEAGRGAGRMPRWRNRSLSC